MSRLINFLICLNSSYRKSGATKTMPRIFLAGMAGVFLFGVLAARPAGAVPVFRTNLNNLDRTGNQTGTDTPTGSTIAEFIQPLQNGISSFGTVDAFGRSISLSGRTKTNSGITVSAGGFSGGFIGFGDLIFTDTNNPGNTGSIGVSANFLSSLSSQITATHFARFSGTATVATVQLSVGVGLSSFGPDTDVSNLFQDFDFDGSDFTTSTINVALNTPLSLVFSAGMEFFSNINTDAAFAASLGLDAIPFNLPDGFTVNSVHAGIFDNSFTAPTQGDGNGNGNGTSVPEPSIFALFGIGLAGFGVMRRRRKSAAH